MIGLSERTKRWIVGIVGVTMIAWSAGWIDPVESIPVWWRLVATGGMLALGAGWIAAGMLNDLLPDDEGIYLVAFTDTDLGGGEIYEINEDQWADLEVHGSLNAWEDSPKRVYECREYDEDRNVAIGNWRESKPGSAIAAEATVDDALAAIRELRLDLEPDAAEARELKRRMRGIIRTLDKERQEAQQATLDDHIAPNVGGSRTISEIIEDSLPDDMHPETMSQDMDEAVARRSNGDDTISFDVLEDDDALDPVAADGGHDG